MDDLSTNKTGILHNNMFGVVSGYYNNSKYLGGCRRIYNIDSILHLKKTKKLTLESDEKLKELDLSGLKSLEEFNLHYMDNLRSLKLNNRKLKKYEQYGCNKLKSLDFSKLKSLKEIYLDRVKLKTIVIARKTKVIKGKRQKTKVLRLKLHKK